MTLTHPMLPSFEELSKSLRELEVALVDLCGVAGGPRDAESALTILAMVRKTSAVTDAVRDEATAEASALRKEAVVLKLVRN